MTSVFVFVAAVVRCFCICLWTGIVLSAQYDTRKVVVITGGSRGIGLACAQVLSREQEYRVIVASRHPPSKAAFPHEYIPLDLCDIQSIRRFADNWQETSLDVLVLNAGIQKPTLDRSKAGFELTVATNHIGSFQLLQQLLPAVCRAKTGRVVVVGSGGKSRIPKPTCVGPDSFPLAMNKVHNPAEAGGNIGSKASLGTMTGLREGFKEPHSMIDGGPFDGDKAYKDSKLCNVMTALEVARRLKAANSTATCNVVNPGLVPTTGLFAGFHPLFVWAFTLLTRYVFRVAVSEEVAGRRLAYMATSPSLEGVSGRYFSGRAGDAALSAVEPSLEAQDVEKARQLWELTENIITKGT